MDGKGYGDGAIRSATPPKFSFINPVKVQFKNHSESLIIQFMYTIYFL